MNSPLVYLANRDKPEYLSKEFLFPHALVSVVGGLGFLSFISAHTRSVVLIDSNPEQIAYCKVILEMIAHVPTLERFTALIGAHGLPSEENLRFMREILGEDGYALYKRTILHALCTDSMVFSTFDRLEPMKFYWRISSDFPYSPFSTPERYVLLHYFLRSHTPTTVCSTLEELDYSTVFSEGVPNILCLTNADCQLYTPSEAIIDKILNTAPRPSSVYYHSWHRSMWLRFDQHHADAIAKIVPYTKGRDVVEVKTYAGYAFNKSDLRALSHSLIGIEGITQFSEYPAPADTLLFHISLSPSDPEREEIAKKFLRIARGNFRRIIILDHCRADEEIVWLRWITGSNLHHSYRVTGLDWSGGETGCSRNIIVALELKGLV